MPNRVPSGLGTLGQGFRLQGASPFYRGVLIPQPRLPKRVGVTQLECSQIAIQKGYQKKWQILGRGT